MAGKVKVFGLIALLGFVAGIIAQLCATFVIPWFVEVLPLWAANMVPYPRAGDNYGTAFLSFAPNMVSFALTAFGLLAVGAIAAYSLSPALKGTPHKVNLGYLGIALVGFATYFIYNTAYYIATGGYDAHPSVWYEVISPMHNANLWAIATIAIGIALIVTAVKKQQNQK